MLQFAVAAALASFGGAETWRGVEICPTSSRRRRGGPGDGQAG